MTADGASFQEAVRGAVDTGRAELLLLDDVVGELATAFRNSHRPGSRQSQLAVDLDTHASKFPQEVQDHLERERGAMGSFNIVFFGRTGAGKSTLLSVFGELDGEYVSPGESDWTTDVNPVAWHGCRLIDTPGINGWGRSETRATLEARARREVETADLVLLCFDSQSQQALEFEKIAMWIQECGKPVVAVLNVRNPRWSHPALVPEARRQHLSESVRQHADNIGTELAKIGLLDTPIVAIHSRRALFARAQEPFKGPGASDFHREREQFGREYLDRWSNFGTLERLITLAIAEGGAALRLTALREDLRSRCVQSARVLEDLKREMTLGAESTELEVEEAIAILGYPEGSARAQSLHDDSTSADLVDLSEMARGRPYTSPREGTLDRHVRHLAASHLAVCRQQTREAADDLIRTAFEDGKTIDEDEFSATVFDDGAIAETVAQIWVDRAEFLQRELDVVASQASADNRTGHIKAAAFRGDWGGGVAGGAVRVGGIAVGAAGLLAVPAIANMWNPAGWALGVVAVGAGLAGQIQQKLGQRMSNKAQERRKKAKSDAILSSHSAIDETFNRLEDELVRESRDAAWALLVPAVREMLREAVELRIACKKIEGLEASLNQAVDDIVPAPAAGNVLKRASRSMGDSQAAATRTLLGEGWLGAEAEYQQQDMDDVVHQRHLARSAEDFSRLAAGVAASWDAPPVDDIRAWQGKLDAAAREDPALFDIARDFWRSEKERPAFVVLGDYNSGKSSLIRRILADSRIEEPTAFDIRAVPATDAVQRYRFPRFDLVDTPGLQSGRDEHDTEALEAIVAAALIFVVVHINLLVGNTSLLEQIARGSDIIAAKGGRMVFLINRCDELGDDPRRAAESFLNRQDGKRKELRAALATRSVMVSPDRIHCLAGDPFGLVGNATGACRADFDENRAWDGVDSLTTAISELTDTQLAEASLFAAFDSAVTDLKRRRQLLNQSVLGVQGEQEVRAPVISVLRAAASDADVLESALHEEARRVVRCRTTAAAAEVERLSTGDMKDIRKIVDFWSDDAEFLGEIQRFLTGAERRVDSWYRDSASMYDRERRAASFQLPPMDSDGVAADEPVGFEDVAVAAGTVVGIAGNVVKTLGSRDAVYAIGKAFKYKFKPWGAIKGAGRVTKVGGVLVAVAAAVDAVSMVNDHRNWSTFEEAQEDAQKEIHRNGQMFLHKILHDDDESGVLGYLGKCATGIREELDGLLELKALAQESISVIEAQVAVADGLIRSADEMVGIQVSEG